MSREAIKKIADEAYELSQIHVHQAGLDAHTLQDIYTKISELNRGPSPLLVLVDLGQEGKEPLAAGVADVLGPKLKKRAPAKSTKRKAKHK